MSMPNMSTVCLKTCLRLMSMPNGTVSAQYVSIKIYDTYKMPPNLKCYSPFLVINKVDIQI